MIPTSAASWSSYRTPTVPRATALLSVMLLVVALLALLWRPAPSSAHGATSACSSRAAHSGEGARACAQRHHRAHARKKRGHHAKRGGVKGKHKTKNGPASNAPAQAVPPPALCEDASTPVREDDSYSCADGSEPVCADGAEPVSASKGTGPVCPAAPTEYGEAECEDGSAPAAGGYGCEDGSQPECEDGTQLTLSADGWTLQCYLSGEGAVPEPASPPGEVSEGGLSDLVSSRS